MLLDENRVLEEGLDLIALSGIRKEAKWSQKEKLVCFIETFGCNPARVLNTWEIHKNTEIVDASIAPGELTVQQYLIGLNHSMCCAQKTCSALFDQQGISEKYGRIVSTKLGALLYGEQKQLPKKRKIVEAVDCNSTQFVDADADKRNDSVSVNADETDDWVVLDIDDECSY